MKTEIVPFGKYKGQPIEALAQDREYCEWLAGQEWVGVRYPTIQTVIVNNFAEASETPEHNQLQGKFTDDAWVEAFVRTYLGPTWWDLSRKEKIARDNVDFSKAIDKEQRDINLWSGGMGKWSDERREKSLSEIEKLRDLQSRRLAQINSVIVPEIRIDGLRFEVKGADVDFHSTVGSLANLKADLEAVYSLPFTRLYDFIHFRVECKPTLGDDYPAVLRQMIASESNVLLIGQGGHRAVGATYEQVKKIFGSSGISIVLLADVNA